MTDFICLDTENGLGNQTPNHGMWLQPMKRRVTLYYENLVIADTSNALRLIEVNDDLLEPVLYLPRKDILADLQSNEMCVKCPLKGTSSNFDLVGSGDEVIVFNAAWSHPCPTSGAEALKDRVAFSKTHFSFEDVPH